MTASESAITGEPESFEKEAVSADNYSSNPCPFVLKSTLIETGEGRAIVTAVGKYTRAGRAEQIMDAEGDPTPLQNKLETIANQIGTVGVYVAVFTFIALFTKVLMFCILDENNSFVDVFFTAEIGKEILEFFVLGLSIIVCAVPEGLPLAVTIALAFSVS